MEALEGLTSSLPFISTSSPFFDELSHNLILGLLRSLDTSTMSVEESSDYIDFLNYDSPISLMNIDHTLTYNPQLIHNLQHSLRYPRNSFAMSMPMPTQTTYPPQYQPRQSFYMPSPYGSSYYNYPLMPDPVVAETSDYEDLLELQERIGRVDVGLSQDTILKNLKTTYIHDQDVKEEGEVCAVCQEKYKVKKKIGILECGHRYHVNCIREWLLHKNVCPICKATALII